MPSNVEALSAELSAELATNSIRPLVDPRTVPVRFSWLKNFAASPAHAFQAVQDMQRYSSTLATRIGSGAHAMTFGTPVHKYEAIRRGKAWDEFRASKGNDPILTVKEWDHAAAISGALKRNEASERLLFSKGVIVEKRIEWEIDGRKCAGTPDARSIYSLVDLKTTKTSHPDRFVRDATWRGYHAQLAWYRDGICAATGAKPQDCYIVAVESRPPYAVTVLRMTDRALEQGARLVRSWFEQLRVCEESGVWPAYCASVVDFDVPDDDLELTFGEDAEESEEE